MVVRFWHVHNAMTYGKSRNPISRSQALSLEREYGLKGRTFPGMPLCEEYARDILPDGATKVAKNSLYLPNSHNDQLVECVIDYDPHLEYWEDIKLS